MHAISSYRGNRPANTQTHTDRTDYNTLRRSFASMQRKNGTVPVTATGKCFYVPTNISG